jgi:hypothetical protein
VSSPTTPLADTGFKAAGDAIGRIPPANPPVFTFTTGAYPNQLNNLGIKGDLVFVPNTGASPNGPFRLNVNTQSLLSVFNRLTSTEVGPPLNMQDGGAVAALHLAARELPDKAAMPPDVRRGRRARGAAQAARSGGDAPRLHLARTF